MQKLMQLSKEYVALIEHLESNEKEWYKWYNSEKPEDDKIPGDFNLSLFQMLLILRVFRSDRVINGVKRFIVEYFNKSEHYIQAPTI